MADLLINGLDALTEYGVRMDDDFIDTLAAPSELKSFVENESRVEDGKRVLISNIRKASREITLKFTLSAKYTEDNGDYETSRAAMQTDFKAKKAKFMSVLESGNLTIKIPKVSDDVYHLIYTGKSMKYHLSRTLTFCTIAAKFVEPNPTNRT